MSEEIKEEITTERLKAKFLGDKVEGKKKKNITLAFLNEQRITSDSNILEPVPVITIDEANFAIKGDISFISGQPKAGKTTICSILIATALLEKIPADMDALKIRSQWCKGKEVIYIDTEQPKPYAKKMLDTICSYMNVHRAPDNFHFYNLRNFANSEKLSIVDALFDQYPEAHLWVIDGIADLMKDPNSSEESSEIISQFMAKASKLNTTIVLVLHENPSSDKMRGHIGSEATRKAGGAISIKKDRKKGIHWIESRVIRGSADFQEVYFHYDKAIGRMVGINAPVTEIEKLIDPAEQKKEKLFRLAIDSTNNGLDLLRFKDLVNKVMILEKVGDRTAATRVKDMVNNKFLEKDSDEQYYLSKNKMDPQPFNHESTEDEKVPF